MKHIYRANTEIADLKRQRDMYRDAAKRGVAALETLGRQRDELLGAAQVALPAMEADAVRIENEWGSGLHYHTYDNLVRAGKADSTIEALREAIANATKGDK